MKKLPKDIRSALSHDASTIRPQFKQQLKNIVLQGDTMATNTTKRNFFSHRYLIPTGAALVLVALVGASTYNYGSTKSEKASLSNIQLPSDLSTIKSVDQISALATVGLIGDVKVTSVSLKQEDGKLVYKVQFSDGSVKFFDATTGDMLAKPTPETEGTELPANFVAGVSIDAARATAQDTFQDKTITKIELENEDGKVVYVVKFSDNSRVIVSAVDGTVISSRDATAPGAKTESENENESDDDKGTTSGSSTSGSTESKEGESKSGSGSSGSGSTGSGDDRSGRN